MIRRRHQAVVLGPRTERVKMSGAAREGHFRAKTIHPKCQPKIRVVLRANGRKKKKKTSPRLDPVEEYTPQLITTDCCLSTPLRCTHLLNKQNSEPAYIISTVQRANRPYLHPRVVESCSRRFNRFPMGWGARTTKVTDLCIRVLHTKMFPLR